jgi:hypothetical protein
MPSGQPRGEEMKRNTAWRITAGAPLLRLGLEISIVVSEKYVIEETAKLLEKVREINEAAQPSLVVKDFQPCDNFKRASDGKCYICGFERSAHSKRK